MGSGLLTGAMSRERVENLPETDWRKHADHFQEPKLSKHLAVAEKCEKIAESHGRSPGEVAVAWTLRHPAVTGAIVGARNAKQVEGVFGAADLQLSDEEIGELNAKR
jgi:aryl-alcohol dehydrogenase-like predicted oxidoreductase